MSRTDSEDRAIKKYEQEKIERILLRVPKGKKAVIQEYATKHGESVNASLNRIIEEALTQSK